MKKPGHAGHEMVADAVDIEPVSRCDFSANREVNRELGAFGGLGGFLNPLGGIWSVTLTQKWP